MPFHVCGGVRFCVTQFLSFGDSIREVETLFHAGKHEIGRTIHDALEPADFRAGQRLLGQTNNWGAAHH
ncbi:hypothetical protein D3C87_1634780 [compost metagenome]